MTNFILIPGAWMGGWVWEPVTDRLRALGHRVHPVTLSGLADEDADVSGVGLETHVDDVLRVLEGDLRNAVVVGHLYAGIVAGQVAEALPEGVPPAAAEVARDTLGGAVAAADRLPDPLGAGLLDAAREAWSSRQRPTRASLIPSTG